MKKLIAKKYYVAMTGILLAGLLSGCGKTDAQSTVEETKAEAEESTQNDAVEETTEDVIPEDGLVIRLGGCDFAIWNPQVNIAIHEGLFEEEFASDNITIETYNFANGPAGNEAIAAGELDLFNGTGEQPFVTAVANNVPVVLLSTTGEQGEGNLVIVGEDSGITKPEDLAGKRIGCYIGTQQHKTWLQYLAGHGIDLDAVEFVNLQGFQELYSAFKQGDIDAFYASQYNYDSIASEGAVVLDNLKDYPSRCYITGREDFLKEYPGVVKRFFKVLAQAQEFIEANPEKSYEYLAEDAGLSVEEVQKTVEGYSLYLSLDENIQQSVQDTYDFLRDQGILESEIDNLKDHYDTSFVDSISQ